MESSQRSWRAVPALIGGAMGGVVIALLLNITAGAIDPNRAPSIVRWGWFALIGVYFPLYLIYVSPAWNWLTHSWLRASRKWTCLAALVFVSSGYLWGVRILIESAWMRLEPHHQDAGISTNVESNKPMPARASGAAIPTDNKGSEEVTPAHKSTKPATLLTQERKDSQRGWIEPQANRPGLALSVTLSTPSNLTLAVENLSDGLADRIRWELVMFRTTDLAFFSFATQDIGYLKAHTRSANYSMNLERLPRAPGGGQMAQGDTFIGSISIDCPTCKGVTLIVALVWGRSGWFYELPVNQGGLYLPKGMSKEAITTYFETIESHIPQELRQPIR